MRQRHRYRLANRIAKYRPLTSDLPHLVWLRRISGNAQTTQVVEADRRIRPGQLHLGVQITQQTISQTFRNGSELLFDIFDHRAQRRRSIVDLPPIQSIHHKRDGVFAGEPPHRGRQINIGAQVLVAAMTFNVNSDRNTGPTQKFRPRQPESDQ
ncbi:hypothetical protein MSIMFI_05509 [Mycobacterium simulans]|nr:hypothetical protein MSIMFI_05509 [Mycobacterium simulans]